MRGICKQLLFAGALLLLAAALSGCGREAAGKLDTISIEREAYHLVAVNVVSDCGSVTVSQGKSDTVHIEPSYRIEADADRRRLIQQNLSVTHSPDGNGLLSVYSQLKDSVTLAGDEQYAIDLDIQIPEGFGSVIVQSQKGDIVIDGIRGAELLLVGNNGDVTVRDTSVIGTSSITCLLGDVDARLRSIADAERLTIAADLGDLRCNVPKSASYTVIVQELSKPASTWKNKDGKTQIALTAKIGKVRFQK